MWVRREVVQTTSQQSSDCSQAAAECEPPKASLSSDGYRHLSGVGRLVQ